MTDHEHNYETTAITTLEELCRSETAEDEVQLRAAELLLIHSQTHNEYAEMARGLRAAVEQKYDQHEMFTPEAPES